MHSTVCNDNKNDVRPVPLIAPHYLKGMKNHDHLFRRHVEGAEVSRSVWEPKIL